MKTLDSSFGGMNFYVTTDAQTRHEDWSRCRSISRAKRRHAQGIKTRMRIIFKPACFQFEGKMLIHPVLYEQLKQQTKETTHDPR